MILPSKVKSKIKQSNIRVFNILQDLKKDDIEEVFNIDSSNYSEFVVKIPMLLKDDTCGYAIFRPVNDEAKEKIKQEMENYYQKLEEKWDNNKKNKELVKNRHFEEYKGYLIYIVSHDNKTVLDLIKGN